MTAIEFALRRPQIVVVELTPYEIYLLIDTIESYACLAVNNLETVDLAGCWFDRADQLREFAR